MIIIPYLFLLNLITEFLVIINKEGKLDGHLEKIDGRIQIKLDVDIVYDMRTDQEIKLDNISTEEEFLE